MDSELEKIAEIIRANPIAAKDIKQFKYTQLKRIYDNLDSDFKAKYKLEKVRPKQLRTWFMDVGSELPVMNNGVGQAYQREIEQMNEEGLTVLENNQAWQRLSSTDELLASMDDFKITMNNNQQPLNQMKNQKDMSNNMNSMLQSSSFNQIKASPQRHKKESLKTDWQLQGRRQKKKESISYFSSELNQSRRAVDDIRKNFLSKQIGTMRNKSDEELFSIDPRLQQNHILTPQSSRMRNITHDMASSSSQHTLTLDMPPSSYVQRKESVNLGINNSLIQEHTDTYQPPPQEQFFEVAIRVGALQHDQQASLILNENTISFNMTDFKEDEEKIFAFEKVYGRELKQKDMYEESALPLLMDSFKGYGTSVIFYGDPDIQDETLMGSMLTEDSRGILPRCLEKMFNKIEEKPDRSQQHHYLTLMSFMEVHNENVYDLLGERTKKIVHVANDPEHGFVVPRCTKHVISSVAQATRLVLKGRARRESGAMGRGHTIISLYIEITSTNTISHHTAFSSGQIDFVSLSNIHRESEHPELLSGCPDINRSIEKLHSLILALADSQANEFLINEKLVYGSSKLTQLLAHSFGGDFKTTLIGCISPRQSALPLTLQTLNYCVKAKTIVNKPKIFTGKLPCTMIRLDEDLSRMKQLLKQQTVLQLAIMKALRDLSGEGDGSPAPPFMSTRLLNQIYGLDSLELMSRRKSRNSSVVGDGAANNDIANIERHIRKLETYAKKQYSDKRTTVRRAKRNRNDPSFEQLGLNGISNDLSELKAKLNNQNRTLQGYNQMTAQKIQEKMKIIDERNHKIEEQEKIIFQLREDVAKMENTAADQDSSMRKLEVRLREEIENKNEKEQQFHQLSQEHQQVMKKLEEHEQTITKLKAQILAQDAPPPPPPDIPQDGMQTIKKKESIIETSPNPESKKVGWDCSKCQYTNVPSAKKCEMCVIKRASIIHSPKRSRPPPHVKQESGTSKSFVAIGALPDPEETLKEGWVMKKRQTSMMKKWDKRFLRLTNKRLIYWKTKPSASSKKNKKKNASGKYKESQHTTPNSPKPGEGSIIKGDDGETWIEILSIRIERGITPFIDHSNNKYGFVVATSTRSTTFQTETLLGCQEWVIKLNDAVIDRHRLIEQMEEEEDQEIQDQGLSLQKNVTIPIVRE